MPIAQSEVILGVIVECPQETTGMGQKLLRQQDAHTQEGTLYTDLEASSR